MEKEQAPPSPETVTDDARKERVSEAASGDKKFGRQIAFGIQQTLACWATDFIDPPVSRYLQNKFGNKNHEVTHKHVWYGEILGDTSAFFTYIGIKRLLSGPVDMAIGAVRNSFSGYFDKMGKKTLKGWANSHHLDESDPRYKKKLEAYKDFQAENMVDSTIIATSATLANVGIQRAVGNKQAYAVILGSKLVGAAATMSVMLGLRTALPTATKALDDELSERYFTKLIRFTQRALGAKQEMATEFAAEDESEMPAKNKEPLAHDKRQRFLASLQRSYKQQGGHDIKEFVVEQKRICQAFVQALYPEGRFAKKLNEQYRQAIQGAGGDGASIDSNVNAFMEDMLLHRRDAMLARLKLLDDSAFLAELDVTLKSDRAFIAAQGISPEKKEKLVASLMQAKTPEAIQQSAATQRQQQAALLAAFDPSSEAAGVLADTLTSQLGSDSRIIAKSYMQERQEAARNVLLALDGNGVVLRQAISQHPKSATTWQNAIASKTAAKGSDVRVAA